MTMFLDMILGRKRVLVKANERVLALYRGEVLGIFGAGEHALPNRRSMLELERHDVNRPAFASAYEKPLATPRSYPWKERQKAAKAAHPSASGKK